MGVSVMKKLVAIATLAAISLFGVSLAGAPAQADHDPYTAGVRTSCNVSVPAAIKRGNAPRIRVNVRPNGPAQGARPKGNVRVTISKAGARVFTKTVAYNGSPVEVQGPVLTQTGRYQVQAVFKTAGHSVFKSCRGSAAIDVRTGQGPDDNVPGPGPQGGPTDPGGLLPDTGGPNLLWLLLALALLGGGGGLVYAGRRRPHAPLYDV
jgi:LPXTG-motif cell wall-anchored protein